MKILSVQQMARIDRLSSEEYGVPGLILMENAGAQLFRVLQRYFPATLGEQRIAVFCGPGNNGGDGFVLARHLLQHGIRPGIYLLGERERVSGDARVNLEALVAAGEEPLQLDETLWRELRPALSHFDLAVDAILGTGISKPLKGLYAELVSSLNSTALFRMAVDIPTGMHADSTTPPSLCLKAHVTVTFTAPKIAHLLNPAQESLGDVHVVPIGTPPCLLAADDLTVSMISTGFVRDSLPERLCNSHKGTYGHIGVLAGSRGKSGAAVLTSWAALRSGCGLVTCLTSASAQPLVAGAHPELMTEALAETTEGAVSDQDSGRLCETLPTWDCVAIGPGLGTAAPTVRLIHQLLDQLEIPIVLDADGLNAFEGHPELLNRNSEKPLILTPHPAEFSRISGIPVTELRERRLEVVPEFSRRHGLWVVLKDFRTIVADPHGRVLVCPAGNPGMATAGSGDTLTGIIASLVGNNWAHHLRTHDAVTASVAAGVMLHAQAGDLAVRNRSLHSLTASAIIEHLDQVFSDLETQSHESWKSRRATSPRHGGWEQPSGRIFLVQPHCY